MRVAVIGGGPAGFFGAISASTHAPHVSVVLFESTRRPLAKVLVSGGGRCNVTNHCFDPAELAKHYPRGGKELRGPFSRFQPRDVIAWFEARGVRLKVEDNDRMFPVTDESATIADCLQRAAADLGAQLRLGVRVTAMRVTESGGGAGRFELVFDQAPPDQFDRLLLATGGSPAGHGMVAALGHTIVPGVPSLFAFRTSDPRLSGLAGVSFERVRLELSVAGAGTGHRRTQEGALLITHEGLSGPAVLHLSSWGARWLHDADYQALLSVDLLPDWDAARLHSTLLRQKADHGRRLVRGDCMVPIPGRYWTRIVEYAGIPEDTTWANLTSSAVTAIESELKCAQFAVVGRAEHKDEFVTCGGVDLREVDFRTMQSKRCPGLHFAGEVLDIDGLTGGFNFQNAWTTGWIAGQSMVT